MDCQWLLEKKDEGEIQKRERKAAVSRITGRKNN